MQKVMDEFDVFSSEPSTTKANNPSEIENSPQTANDGSSSLIEDVRKSNNP